MKVIVVEYDKKWPERFNIEKEQLEKAINNEKVIIEHIGSTSVVNLSAKPIIDIMIGLPDFSIANEY